MSNGNDTGGTRPVTRDEHRQVLQQALHQVENAAVDAVRATRRATNPAPIAAHRAYRSSRRDLLEARDDLQELLNAAADAMLEVQDLLETYPEAHTDDYTDDYDGSGIGGGAPGYCRCGRWRTSCPARKALERGESMWVAEDGRIYPVDGGPEITWLPAL